MTGAHRIDVHHHVIPSFYEELLRDKGIRPGGIDLPKWSAAGSLRMMRADKVATAILSVSTPGAWFGDAAEAARLARRLNDYSAQLVADHPTRFGFFATLTLPDVDAARREAAYALDTLRADGIILLANNEGLYLGDPAFEPLLADLHERRAVVFVHPGELPGGSVPGIPSFTADFLLDTTRTAISLILSGAMEKYSGIRWILAHAGGFVPYISYRILLTMLRNEPKWRLAAMALDRHRAVAERMAVFRRFYYDVALSSTSAALPSLLAVADPSHIVFGTDYPFAPPAAVKFMGREYDDTPLDDAVRAGIDRTNAELLFPRLARTIR